MKNSLLFKLSAAGCLAFALNAYSTVSVAQTRIWGTYYGGEGTDYAGKIAVDSIGNTYVIGNTTSKTGIATPDGFDSVFDKSTQVYLAKFSSSGKLVWATYYGDNSAQGYDLGLDASGNVYIVGTILCPSTKLSTPAAFDSTCGGLQDTFVAKFDPNGKRLWSTYYGGDLDDFGMSISVTRAGNIYITGFTNSSSGITPAQSVDPSLDGWSDAFIANFSASGQLIWARYFGGENSDIGEDISCKESGTTAPTCYFAGYTFSKNGIATFGAHDITLNNTDGFVTKFNSANGAIEWSTYYGGSGTDSIYSIAVDQNMNVYVGGSTKSSDALTTINAHDTTYNGIHDGFLARFNSAGVRQVGTYFGASGADWAQSLALDSDNNLYVIGRTEAAGNFATLTAFDKTFNGAGDAYIAKFNQVLVLLRSTYYGGNGTESQPTSIGGSGIAIDKDKHLYVLGHTDSVDSMATQGAHKTAPEDKDVFIAEFLP